MTGKLVTAEDIGSMCLECGAISFNRNDAREGYCGRCHAWTGAVPLPPDLGSALIRIGKALAQLGPDQRAAGAMVASELAKALAGERRLREALRDVRIQAQTNAAHEAALRTIEWLVGTALGDLPSVPRRPGSDPP